MKLNEDRTASWIFIGQLNRSSNNRRRTDPGTTWPMKSLRNSARADVASFICAAPASQSGLQFSLVTHEARPPALFFVVEVVDIDRLVGHRTERIGFSAR